MNYKDIIEKQTIDDTISTIRKYHKNNPCVPVSAIKGSIAKWDLIAHGILVNKGGENCPLCQVFGCIPCPVYLKTYGIQCRHTPYVRIKLPRGITMPEWIHYPVPDKYKILGFGNKVNETFEAIEKEIEFLISLLPIEEQEVYKI